MHTPNLHVQHAVTAFCLYRLHQAGRRACSVTQGDQGWVPDVCVIWQACCGLHGHAVQRARAQGVTGAASAERTRDGQLMGRHVPHKI